MGASREQLESNKRVKISQSFIAQTVPGISVGIVLEHQVIKGAALYSLSSVR